MVTNQSINDYLHRTMKGMQLLMGERYPLHINCRGIEIFPYLFEIRCLITLEGGDLSPYDLINIFGSFSSHFATMKFFKN